MPNHIREMRERKGISQAELARRLKVSRSYINTLENNKKTPNLRMAVRIAEALGCTLNDIFLP